jgi:hypothetical protein
MSGPPAIGVALAADRRGTRYRPGRHPPIVYAPAQSGSAIEEKPLLQLLAANQLRRDQQVIPATRIKGPLKKIALRIAGTNVRSRYCASCGETRRKQHHLDDQRNVTWGARQSRASG